MTILEDKLKQESDRYIQQLLNGDEEGKIHYTKTREQTKKLFFKFVAPFNELELSEMMSVSSMLLGVTLYYMWGITEDDSESVDTMFNSVIDAAADYAQHLKIQELQELNKRDANN